MTVPNVIVVTDIGNDYDDMMALLILGYYHRLNKIKLRGVIVTLKPVLKRAQMAHGLFRSMGIDVEVAMGTEGELDKERERAAWTEEALTADFVSRNKNDFRNHLQLSKSVFNEVEEENEKIRFLSLAGLKTSWEIVGQDKDLFARVVSEVHCQGGCQWNPAAAEGEKVIMAREDARNNQDDKTGANKFYKFVQDRKIPCTAYEKEAAFTCAFQKTIFDPAKASQRMTQVAEYIYKIHDRQKTVYYEDACHKPLMVWMDRDWFVNNCCTKDLPEEFKNDKNCAAEKILPYTTVVPYDPIAALGCIQDVAGVNIPKGPVQYPDPPKGATPARKITKLSPVQDPEEMELFATCKRLTKEQGVELAEGICDHMRMALELEGE
jgi:hypothetical protein